MRLDDSVLETPELHAAPETGPARCHEFTRKGAPCRGRPAAGEDVCPFHRRPARKKKSNGSAGPARSVHKTDQGLRDEILRKVETASRTFLRQLKRTGLIPGLQVPVIVSTIREALSRLLSHMGRDLLNGIQDAMRGELPQPDSWKRIGEMVFAGLQARRGPSKDKRHAGVSGAVDEFGLDYDFYESMRPLVEFIYRHWFRVETSGIENVPAEGRAMMVANHSGILPWDAVMLSEAIWEAHPRPRHARLLFLKWFATLPFIAPLLAKSGQVLACPENGKRLLESDQLIGVFPEGVKGIGKLYKDRYKLARFGRGGFIRLALQTGSPIVPVAIVGAEETYPALTQLDFAAKLAGLPYLPVTPTFPWFGLLGFVPLPTRWHIHFCKPIRFNEKAPSKADDFLVVSLLTDRVRHVVQEAIYELLRRRKSVF